jgi:hypothetical protein
MPSADHVHGRLSCRPSCSRSWPPGASTPKSWTATS